MSNAIDTVEDSALELSQKEQYALNYWLAKKEPPLAPITQAKLFELYLNGNDCDAIRRLNPGFSLGQIVQAKVSGKWERQKREYQENLISSVRERALQVQLESVNFAADLLSAAHKLHGDKLKRFLQTGDPKDLGDLSITNLKSYKEALELLLKSMGQDKKMVGEVTHTHKVQPPQTESRVFAQNEHSQFLDYMAKKVK